MRHAESTWNSIGDTSRDCPITDNGKNQSAHLQGDYDVVICSTLKRARQTLDNSNIKYKEVIFTDLCREWLTGNPPDYYSGEDIKYETKEELFDRINKLKELLKDIIKKGKTVCVMTHFCFKK